VWVHKGWRDKLLRNALHAGQIDRFCISGAQNFIGKGRSHADTQSRYQHQSPDEVL
jgi:hypothetical protein